MNPLSSNGTAVPSADMKPLELQAKENDSEIEAQAIRELREKKNSARDRLVNELVSTCLTINASPSPFYYLPLLLGGALSLRRKSDQLVPLVIGAVVARKADYSTAEANKNALNLLHSIKFSANGENVLEKYAEYDEAKGEYQLNTLKFVEASLFPKRISYKDNFIVKHDHVFHSKIEISDRQYNPEIKTALFCDLL